MVGIGTALVDDPALTVRLTGLDRKPLRVVLDTHLRLPERSRLAATAGEIPTLVIAGAAAPDEAARRLEGARRDDRARRPRRGGPGRSPSSALRALAARGITRVFSEGGPAVAARLIALGLADEVALITAEKPLGRPGVPALDAQARAALPDGSQYRPVETLAYGPDTMRLWERVVERTRPTAGAALSGRFQLRSLRERGVHGQQVRTGSGGNKDVHPCQEAARVRNSAVRLDERLSRQTAIFIDMMTVSIRLVT